MATTLTERRACVHAPDARWYLLRPRGVAWLRSMRHSLLFAVLPATILLLGSAVTTTARADGEAWLWTENRVPILTTSKPEFPRLDWRVITDFRVNQRSGGLHQAFLRTGPAFYPTRWAFFAINGTVCADRLPDGRFDEEARVELEPNFFGRFGDFTFNDRNRLEYRYRDTEERWRYRNQLRVNYAPSGARWIPFVWDEVLVDLSGLGFNQNRAEVGLARMLTDALRLDVGYMFRSREAAGDWTHDHIVNLYFFFDVPPKRPVEQSTQQVDIKAPAPSTPTNETQRRPQ